ncbi:MAG TPA: 4Fe-4S double cluster binding domain-containing protein [Acidimicrobiia bacterium]|nr:4Fe-4S double cluster binding domain-containing protein [Acidimicrobiia bacterium]
MDLLETLASVAGSSGARIGVTDLAPFGEARLEIDRRAASGERGSLRFVYADPAVSTEPARSFPWAKAIVVAAVPYLAEGDGVATRGQDDGEADVGRPVARFADGDRYSSVRSVLDAIAAVLDAHGFRTECVYDDDRLVDRAAAVRSGVAWWGKSTMVLSPGLGPWFLIGSVVTDAPIEPTEPMERSCGTCVACMPACPTGAIVSPGVLDARRCLAAVFQARGPIPIELRTAAGDRVYGCDACLVACPPGHGVLGSHRAGPLPRARDILGMTDDEIDEAFTHWYIPGRNARFVRRNAIVAMANGANADDLAVAAGYLGHPDPLLRSHAAWAVARIGTPAAAAILTAAGLRETDREVVEEIRNAMPR